MDSCESQKTNMIVGEFLWMQRLVQILDDSGGHWIVRCSHKNGMLFEHECDTEEFAKEYFLEIIGRLMHDLYTLEEYGYGDVIGSR